MDVGEPQRIIEIEPAEEPIPAAPLREPVPQPAPVPA